MESVEVCPADGITDRNQNIHARLDQHPLIDRQIHLAFRFGFVSQNPGRQRCRAVESLRQESQRTLESMGHDPFHALQIDEDPKREENLEINGNWLLGPRSEVRG